MSLANKPIRDDILARLNSGAVEFHDTEVPDEDTLPTSNGGFVKPYGLVYFTQPVRAAVGRGIVSTRRDTNRAGLTVQVNAHRPEDAARVADWVVDTLTGHTPPDASELTLEGGASGNNGTGTSKPTMYIQYITFSYFCNLIVG